MIHYYVNNEKQTNGDHEVHQQDCLYLPADRNDLGWFENCQAAVREAKKTYPQSNGCLHCSPECHTQ